MAGTVFNQCTLFKVIEGTDRTQWRRMGGDWGDVPPWKEIFLSQLKNGCMETDLMRICFE